MRRINPDVQKVLQDATERGEDIIRYANKTWRRYPLRFKEPHDIHKVIAEFIREDKAHVYSGLVAPSNVWRITHDDSYDYYYLWVWEGTMTSGLKPMRHSNPRGDYGLRQYIIQKDGSALYIARIRLELHAKLRSAILGYTDWLLKLPGMHVKETQDSYLQTYFHHDFRIDADSNRYGLTNEQIDNVLEHIDRVISDKVTLLGTRTETGRAWHGKGYSTDIAVTSLSMRHLTAYMERTWPTARAYSPGERYFRDEKRRHVAVDYRADIFLDTPVPEYVGGYGGLEDWGGE